MLFTGRANDDLARYHSISDLLADVRCKCGTPLQEGWHFCPTCGQRQKASPTLDASKIGDTRVKRNDEVLTL